MSEFAYELATLMDAQARAVPGHADGPYSMPWYLVIGEPGTGRSSAIKALNLSWPRGDGPVPMTQPQPACTYWLPEKAVFIEPQSLVVGPNRGHTKLQELCYELKVKRPREPVDGIVLVVSAASLADFSDEAVERYGKAVRTYLVEIAQALGADVPCYVVASGYDDLWGFGDVFQWTQERRDEEAWGFSLPVQLPDAKTPERVRTALEALTARIESMCFAKLSSEDPSDVRARAFQHLSEARDVMQKLIEFMNVITMANAFERAPWVRALVLGSAIPGTGQRLRHKVPDFQQMGLAPPNQSGTPQPGGMPMHALLEAVLLPERDIVPTRVRWRDDKLFLIALALGVLAWIGFVVMMVLRAKA